VGITDILDVGLKVLDRVIPDPAAKAAAQLELVKLTQQGDLAALAAETDLAKGQIAVNQAEASSGNFFNSGWRPSVGWVCSSGLAYQFLVRPLLVTLSLPAPALEMDTLMTLLLGLLGLGGMRTVEKLKGRA
jgi:Holin of 3TMs, for gene-transfer release